MEHKIHPTTHALLCTPSNALFKLWPDPLPPCPGKRQSLIKDDSKKKKKKGCEITGHIYQSDQSSHSVQQTTHIRWPCHSNTGSLLLLHLAVEVVVSVFIAKVASVSSTLTGTLTCTTGLTREPEHTEQQSVTTCKRAAVSDSFFTEVPFFFHPTFFCQMREWKVWGNIWSVYQRTPITWNVRTHSKDSIAQWG